MVRINKIIYTLDPCSENTLEHYRKTFQQFINFMSSLTPSAVSRLESILMIVGSRLHEIAKVSNFDCNKYMNKLYRADQLEFIKSYIDNKELTLIERVEYYVSLNDNNEARIEVAPHKIDNKIIKSLLLSYVHVFWPTNNDDYDKIIDYYGLNDYIGAIKPRTFNDIEHHDYVIKYYYYLYSFYSRNDSPDSYELHKYKHIIDSNIQLEYYVKGVHDDINLKLTLPKNISKDEALKIIDEYRDAMKRYVELMYQYNYSEDYLKSTTGKGKSHYSVKFRTYDKCLRVYDKYKDKVADGDSIDDEKYGVKIDKEEHTTNLPESKRLYRRKDIRKHFNMALELIAQSAQGHLT